MTVIPVVDGKWSEAITEAVRRRHEHQGDEAVVSIISLSTEQEVDDDNTR
jgi:hypothetical protein